MRAETREKMRVVVAATVAACKLAAERLSGSGVSPPMLLGLAWSICQNAALVLREELQATPEGRVFLDSVEEGARAIKARS